MKVYGMIALLFTIFSECNFLNIALMLEKAKALWNHWSMTFVVCESILAIFRKRYIIFRIFIKDLFKNYTKKTIFFYVKLIQEKFLRCGDSKSIIGPSDTILDVLSSPLL